MDINTLANLIIIYATGFLAGWGVVLFLLWIRPEYMFLLFYVFVGFLLVFLLDLRRLSWADAGDYAMWTARDIAIHLLLGVPTVALFKWLKTRKTGADRQLDKDMERIRAEIAAREAQ